MQRLIEGDALQELRRLPHATVHTCVTSPPYYGLRDYGIDGQLGLEETPAIYIDKLVEIFREVRRVLRHDGTLWLNIGDTYSAGGRGGGGKQDTNKGSIGLGAWKVNGYAPKQLLGIPWRLAFALQEDGWYLRQDIISHKPNPMPESAADRCTKAHEYIFLLAKSPIYYYDADAIREPYSEDRRAAGMPRAGKFGYDGKTTYEDWYHRGRKRATWHPATSNLLKHGRATKFPGSCVPTLVHPAGRNKRSVWTVPPKPYRGAHFATFPQDLIEPCILAGAPINGNVLDPFMGTGTTGVVATKHGRNFVGIELTT